MVVVMPWHVELRKRRLIINFNQPYYKREGTFIINIARCLQLIELDNIRVALLVETCKYICIFGFRFTATVCSLIVRNLEALEYKTIDNGRL